MAMSYGMSREEYEYKRMMKEMDWQQRQESKPTKPTTPTASEPTTKPPHLNQKLLLIKGA